MNPYCFLVPVTTLVISASLVSVGHTQTAQIEAPSKNPLVRRTYRLGDLARHLPGDTKAVYSVDESKKESGVRLYVCLDKTNPEVARKAIASFFSHEGAISRWEPTSTGERFVLSSRYGAAMGQARWGEMMIALFDDMVKYRDLPPGEREQLKNRPSLYHGLRSEFSPLCVELMAGVFDRATLEKMLRGEADATVEVNALNGTQRKLAEDIYAKVLANGVRRDPIENPRLTFRMRRIGESEIVGSLWIETEGKNGPRFDNAVSTPQGVVLSSSQSNGASKNFLGWFSQQEAEEELKSFWLVTGDTPLTLPERLDTTVPAVATVEVPTGSYAATFAEVSKRFNVPVIAVFPKAQSGKQLRIFPTLEQTLRGISDSGERICYKKRGGVLLACPASFLGDKGVAVALPLATVRALNDAAKRGKGGFPALTDYASLCTGLSDGQIEENASEYGLMRVMRKWNVFLRALNRQKTVAERFAAGDEIVLDKNLAIALNVVLNAEQNPGKAAREGDRVRLTESITEIGRVDEMPKEYPHDYIVLRNLTLTGRDAAGKTLFELTDYDAPVNPKYANGIPATP